MTHHDVLANELHLQDLLDSIDGVVFEYDLELDRFVVVRGKAEAMLGFPAEKWLEPGFWASRVHPEDLDGAHGFCVASIEAKRDHQFEYRMLARDGRIVWVHDHVTVMVREGRPHSLRGVILDVTDRRSGELALREMRDRFASLLDQLSVGLLFESEDRKILFSNRALCDAFGVESPETLIGQDCRAALQMLKSMFADPNRAQERVEELVARREPVMGEDVALRDGRFFQRSYLPFDVRGQPIGHLWEFQDVTKRRESERALSRISSATSTQTGDEFFRVLVRELVAVLHARVGFVSELLSEPSGRLRTLAVCSAGSEAPANVECERVGTPCDFVLLDGELVVDGTLAEQFPEHFATRVYGARSYVGVPLYSASRTGLGVLALLFDGPIPSLDDTRSILRICAGRAGAELERQRAEKALRESEERNRALLHSMPDIIFLLDAEGVFIDCHASDPELLLMKPEAFLGRRWSEVLPPEMAAVFATHLAQARETRRTLRFDFELEISGESRLFEYRVLTFDDERQLIIARDMTEQRRLEERLMQSQKLESIGRLAGGVAHDFNNLLTGILSYAEIGEQEAGAGPLADYFLRIRQASERAAELTQQLLAFARKQIVAPRVVVPNQLIEEMLVFLRRVIGEQVQLETELSQEAWRTRIDPTQFYSVLMYLVVNARDALVGGGAAWIATRNVVIERDTDGLPAGEYIELCVSDNGIGMDASTRAHVFEPFFTTKSAGRGTGMGLATCYGIVRQNGGSIRVESRAGEGTDVLVCLPRVDSPCEETPVESDKRPHGSEVVLLVEDEGLVRELAAHTLQNLGYEVLMATDGVDALEVAAAHVHRIDMLVTDVVMPRMSGDALAAKLHELRADLPVLFITGYAPTDDDFGLPHADVLRKPFATSAFARKVREVLDRRPRV